MSSTVTVRIGIVCMYSVIVVSECAGITMNVLYLNQRFLYMNQSWGFEEKGRSLLDEKRGGFFE